MESKSFFSDSISVHSFLYLQNRSPVRASQSRSDKSTVGKDGESAWVRGLRDLRATMRRAKEVTFCQYSP